MTDLDLAGQQPDVAPGHRADGPVADSSNRYLTFRLDDEVFALSILDITEIIEYRSLTAVPMMPPFIRGVLNLRGRVVPVVDLAARFGRGSTTLGRRTGIVIVETGAVEDADGDRPAQDFGIIVDAVNEVVHFGAGDIEPPPAFGGGIRADFISGMARRNGDFIIVLDVNRVLSVVEMIQLGHTVMDGGPAGHDLAAGTAEAARNGATEGELAGAAAE